MADTSNDPKNWNWNWMMLVRSFLNRQLQLLWTKQKWHKNLRIFNISGRLRCTTQFKMKMNRFADFFLPIRSLSLKWNWCWCWPISSLCLPFKRLQLWNSHQRVISIVSLVTLMYAWKSHRIQWKWITIHVNNLCSLERATTPHENEQK